MGSVMLKTSGPPLGERAHRENIEETTPNSVRTTEKHIGKMLFGFGFGFISPKTWRVQREESGRENSLSALW